MKPLSEKCRDMLAYAKTCGICLRKVRGLPAKKWQVGDRYFHEFTGDALVNRGLLENVIYEHDGNSFDRFIPT